MNDPKPCPSRLRFEEWAKSTQKLLLDRVVETGQYYRYSTKWAWLAWQAAQAWLPIASAPTADGSKGVFREADGHEFVGQYRASVGQWCEGPYSRRPVLWMPLPTAPTP